VPYCYFVAIFDHLPARRKTFTLRCSRHSIRTKIEFLMHDPARMEHNGGCTKSNEHE